MNELEKRLSEKLKKNSRKQKHYFSDVKGKAEQITYDTCFEIVNKNDFEGFTEKLSSMIEEPLQNGKALPVKKFVCYVKENRLVFEAVIDKSEKTYYLGNIVIRIHPKIIRYQSDERILFLDDTRNITNGNTIFINAENGFLTGVVFETNNDYIGSIQEGIENKNKILYKIKKRKTISGEQHKIRYSTETGKLFIRN